MKTQILYLTLALCLLVNFIGRSQSCDAGSCNNFTNQYPLQTFSTSSSSWTVVSAYMNAGNWTLFNVEAGNTYQWSYCNSFGGSQAWDAELTLFKYSTGEVLCHQDNCGLPACPNAPYLEWTATFTGVVRLLTSASTTSSCQSNTGAPYSTLVWRQSATGCTGWSISPDSDYFEADGGNGYFTVYASTSGCSFYALSDDAWINNLTFPGGGQVHYHIDQNTGDLRVGSISIYDENFIIQAIFEVTQEGAAAPLSTPTGFTATAVSSSSIVLEWNSVSGATSYDVYTCANGFIANVSGTSYTVGGLNANTYYEYKVRARNAVDVSSFTACEGATTTGGSAPSTPTGFTATAVSSSSIALGWNSVSGATSYDIYTCSGGFITNVQGPSYTVNGLAPGTYYEYKVRAKNTAGVSSFTACEGATTMGGEPLSTPTGFTATTVSSTSIALEWNDVSGATSYDVYTCANGFTANVQNSSYTVTGLNPETYYSYKVRAKNAVDISSFTSCEGATTYGSGNDLSVNVISPNGGEMLEAGTVVGVQASISGSILAAQIEFSSDGGNTWTFVWGTSMSGGDLDYLWTVPYVVSTACKIRVAILHSGGVLLDESDAYFSISSSSGGIGFSLNENQVSHLYWPFPNSTWVNRNGWIGAQGGPERPFDGYSGGNGFGEDGHVRGEYYADDWNNTNGDCMMEFFSPLSGTVIYANNACSPYCEENCTCSGPGCCCGNGYGNHVVIQSDIDPDFAFRAAHFYSLYVSNGQHVEAGEPIGQVGMTGKGDGSHVHCVLYKNINSLYDDVFTGLQRLSMGLSCGIHDSSSSPGPNNFAAEFIFDAVQGGAGGGEDLNVPLIVSGSTNLCEGESLMLEAGISGVSYYWNTGETTPSITVSEPGVYGVIITDASGNAYSSELVTVTLNSFLGANINIVGGSSCVGDTMILSAIDFSNIDEGIEDVFGYGFSWSSGSSDPVISVVENGSYSVTVSDPFGCGQTFDQMNVAFSSPPPQPEVQVNGNQLASSTINQGSYQWNLNGVEIEGANSQFYTAEESGYYTVTVTDLITGCSSTSDPVFIVTSVHNEFSNHSIELTPNPSNGKFVLSVTGVNVESIRFEVTNSVGQVLYEESIPTIGREVSEYLDFDFLPNGIYYLKVIADGYLPKTVKIVLQRSGTVFFRGGDAFV